MNERMNESVSIDFMKYHVVQVASTVVRNSFQVSSKHLHKLLGGGFLLTV